MAQAISDESAGDFVPFLVVGVVVVKDWSVRFCIVFSQMKDDPAQGLGGAPGQVGGGTVAYLFAFDSILLIRELERGEGDSAQVRLVIQRCVDGVVDLPIHGEVDVAEEEGLTPGVRGFRVEVHQRRLSF